MILSLPDDELNEFENEFCNELIFSAWLFGLFFFLLAGLSKQTSFLTHIRDVITAKNYLNLTIYHIKYNFTILSIEKIIYILEG